jgi:hypothetical protein
VPSIRSLRRAVPFDSRFLERHPLLWPLARAATAFAGHADWPAVDSWRAVFADARTPPIGFAAAAPPPRRRPRPPRSVATLYDSTIVERGVVPSRERHWHDFANALVWGTFPHAKAALHRRQGALVAARIDPARPRLPAHRSREQDGLAMIDEGGVVALTAPAAELWLVFGHAVHEGFVLGVRGMTARLVRLPVPALAADPIAQADAALATALADPTFSTLPSSLPRAFVPDEPVAPWVPAPA